MSDVSEAAIVSVMLADYAVADSVGKLNVIGGGVSVLGLAQTGGTAPFALVVRISVPPSLYDAECSVEIVLEDASGDVVSLPGPLTEAQRVRIGQAVTLVEPNVQPGIHVPRRTLPARQQFVVNFALGLPLAIGEKYTWRVRIDGATRDDWVEEFYVPGPAPGPVIG